MKRERTLGVLLFIMLFASDLSAGEELLYAIRYESLQRYPDIVSTKIYSLSPETRQTQLIFSDENTSIMLLAKRGMPGHPGEVLVSSKNRIFAHAVEKRVNPGRWYPNKASIYELSADGSNSFTKIFDVEGEQSLSKIFVNSDGSKIGYLNYLNQKPFIFIHKTETRKLLHKIDVSKIFLDCFASSIGWLPDEEGLFFTLDTGDVHMTSEASYKKIGSYIIRGEGTDLVKLPEKSILFPLEKGFWRATTSPPILIGGLPNGSYVFRDVKTKQGSKGTLFVYELNLVSRSKKEIPLKVSEGLNWFKLSHTGRHMAFTEKTYSKEGKFEWVENLWLKDLFSGEENKAFVLDNMPFKGHYLGLVGWSEN